MLAETGLTAEGLAHAQAIWNYLVYKPALQKADFILALGNHDERTAVCAAETFLTGWAPLMVTSGRFHPGTQAADAKSEAEIFAEIALVMGVPRAAILIEDRAENTGENLTFTRALLRTSNMIAQTGILVTKPYMTRRAYATAARQWPEIEWSVTAPARSFIEYLTESVSPVKTLNIMAGDLQRMRLYVDKGFQIPQEVPTDVWASYEYLRDHGYDTAVIRESHG